MQANDLIADLRAEVSAWWEGKMADHRSSVIAAAAAALVTNPDFLFTSTLGSRYRYPPPPRHICDSLSVKLKYVQILA
jgi:hypothetical protein